MDVGDEGLWQLQVLLGALEISAPKIGRGRRTLKRDREMAAVFDCEVMLEAGRDNCSQLDSSLPVLPSGLVAMEEYPLHFTMSGSSGAA